MPNTVNSGPITVSLDVASQLHRGSTQDARHLQNQCITIALKSDTS